MDTEPRGQRPLRQPLHPAITEAMIEDLVRHFYGRVRQDPALGPIFDSRIENWEPHLETMMAFWSSIMLMSGRYKGEPMVKHKALNQGSTPVGPEHFTRWLALFEESARERCPPPVAALFAERAERIAESLKLGMFGLPELRASGGSRRSS